MMLPTLKHTGHWEFMERMFGLKGQTFEQMIRRFITLLYPVNVTRFVYSAETEWKMSRMIKDERLLKNFQCERYTTDVTFQQPFRQSSNVVEERRYFSGKYKLYGYKCEIFFLPFSLPIAVSDLEISQTMK